MASTTNSRLSKRERVLRTFRFEETDRVPFYDIIQNDGLIESSAKEFLAGKPLTPVNGLAAKGFAIAKFLDMTRMPDGPAEPGEIIQENGIRIQQERWTSWITSRPFHDTIQAENWIKQEIQRADRQQYDQGFAEQFHAWMDQVAALNGAKNGDPAVQVIESGVGFTEIYWQLGWEIFAELLADSPDLLVEWLESRHQAELRRVAAIADPRHILAALTYDDIAYKTGLLVSPVWLRKHWIPRLKRLVSAWHDRDIYCVFHSDGNLWKILPDLVQTGIDGLNPLEVLAGMEVAALRQAYPNLILTGGIDVSQLLSLGTPAQIQEACRSAVNATQGCGYFMGSTTELHWEIPLENLHAMLQVDWRV